MGWYPTHTDEVTWDGGALNDPDILGDITAVEGVYITKIEGLMEHPPFRVENQLRPGKHGARPGVLKLAARTFTVEGVVWGADHDDLEARKSALQSVLVPD